MDKVDTANKLIKDLSAGKITNDEFDQKLNADKYAQEKEERIRNMKIKEEIEKKRKGRRGMGHLGHKIPYKNWCR